MISSISTERSIHCHNQFYPLVPISSHSSSPPTITPQSLATTSLLSVSTGLLFWTFHTHGTCGSFKMCKAQVTFRLIKSSRGTTQASGVFKTPRRFQRADNVGNHRCVGFLGLVFHVILFLHCFQLLTQYKV